MEILVNLKDRRAQGTFWSRKSPKRKSKKVGISHLSTVWMTLVVSLKKAHQNNIFQYPHGYSREKINLQMQYIYTTLRYNLFERTYNARVNIMMFHDELCMSERKLLFTKIINFHGALSTIVFGDMFSTNQKVCTINRY